MPYTILQNDIVQITLVTHMPAVQKVLNTYHYRYTGVSSIPDGRAAIATLIDDWSNPGDINSLTQKLQLMFSDQAVIEEVWGQKLYPVRYAKVVHDLNIVGARVEEPLPAAIQFSIVKKGEEAARHNIGGNRYSGLGEDLEAQGQLTAPALLLADALAENTVKVFTDTAGRTWEPIVYRRLTPGVSAVIKEARPSTILGTQRTRISFRGI